MQITLSEHFTYKKLFHFTLPAILNMLFTSIYLVFDGFFVSNFVGKDALAAINIVYPVIMIISAIGFMFGTGGSALVAKTLGEGDEKRAREQFSLINYFAFFVGIALTLPCFIFLPSILNLFGATGSLHRLCLIYGRILLSTSSLFLVQMMSQAFFITAERANVGLLITTISFSLNIVLDFVFCALFKLGITGAAFATAISQALGGLLPILYFTFQRKNRLRFTKTNLNSAVLIKSSSNGLSELLTNLSASIVSILYNSTLLRLAGEDGVAAYCVLMYVNMVFLGVFLGFSSGSAPLVSYNYGARNIYELKNITRKVVVIISSSSILMLLLSYLLGRPLSLLFVSYDKNLLEMTINAFHIYSFSFLFAGVSIFSSAFFTALNNGIISATISFFRCLILPAISILLFAYLFALDGVWFSILASEILSFFISIYSLFRKRKSYLYF